MSDFQTHLAAAVVAAVGSVLMAGAAYLIHAALSTPMLDDDD